jgi:hypothetical protein
MAKAGISFTLQSQRQKQKAQSKRFTALGFKSLALSCIQYLLAA